MKIYVFLKKIWMMVFFEKDLKNLFLTLAFEEVSGKQGGGCK
jgi:hypothetical protein